MTSTPASCCSDDDGFVRECGTDEVGMLLARAHDATGTATTALRGVFSREDAWLATGDLFRRDADGDYWRLDNVRELIHTAGGPVFTAPIRDALGTLPAVDLAVAYGVPRGRGEHELALAAVTVRDGLRARRRVAVGGPALAARRISARRSCTWSTRSR